MPQQAILRFSSPSVLRLLLDCSSGSILLGARNGLMNFKNWDMVRERKIALLIDAENISPHRIGQIIAPAKNNLGGLVTSSVYMQIGLSLTSLHGRQCLKSMPSFLFSSILLPQARTLRILPW